VSESPRIGIWIYLSACHPVGRCHGEHTNRSKLHHHGNYAVPRGYLSLLSTAVLSREVPAVQFLLFASWNRFTSVCLSLKLCTVQYLRNTSDEPQGCLNSIYCHAEPNVSYGRYCTQEEGTWSLFARVLVRYRNFQIVLNNITYVNILTVIYVHLCSRITALSFNISDWNLTFEIQETLWDECNQTNNYRNAKPITWAKTEEWSPTRCYFLLYYAYARLNIFRAPLCPSSGAHDDSVGYHIGHLVLEELLVGKLSAGRVDECPDRKLYSLRSGQFPVANCVVWKCSICNGVQIFTSFD